MDFDNLKAAVRLTSPDLELPLAGLAAEDLRRLAAAAKPRKLLRGEILLRRGEPPDSVHFLANGRLAIVEDDGEIVSEIAPGEPVGEIGFFAGVPRTFTVKAIRNSEVLTLTRETFDAASADLPGLRDSVIRALALRLARLRPARKAAAPPRTIAVVPAAGAELPPRFLALLRVALRRHGPTLFLSRDTVLKKLRGRPLDHEDTTGWLNALEAGAARVVYVADAGLTEWTRICVRQADLLLLAAPAGGPTDLGEAERFALEIHARPTRRLVLLHDKRSLCATGTAAWLAQRDVFMHHHVALTDGADVERLARFLSGRAVGFVAGGGGALGSAHLGVYQAFCEAGVEFDIFGGTSVGSAMAAALAMGVEVDEIERRMHRIFVERRAFRRFNFPYHGLIDHKTLDAALSDAFADARIEDLWRPFFALSSDVTDRTCEGHRDGLVWRAVRASSAIPGALPPCFTADGRMLVDGGLFDNVPLAFMKTLKSGPNLVVALMMETSSRHAVDYDSIPGPRDWLVKALTPWRRRPTGAPNLVQVIILSLLANRQPLELGPEDLLIHPDMPADAQWLQWRRHRDVFASAYRGASRLIETRRAAGDAQLAALIGR